MFFSNLDTNILQFYHFLQNFLGFRCLYTNICLLLLFFRTKNINSVKIWKQISIQPHSAATALWPLYVFPAKNITQSDQLQDNMEIN